MERPARPQSSSRSRAVAPSSPSNARARASCRLGAVDVTGVARARGPQGRASPPRAAARPSPRSVCGGVGEAALVDRERSLEEARAFRLVEGSGCSARPDPVEASARSIGRPVPRHDSASDSPADARGARRAVALASAARPVRASSPRRDAAKVGKTVWSSPRSRARSTMRRATAAASSTRPSRTRPSSPSTNWNSGSWYCPPVRSACSSPAVAIVLRLVPLAGEEERLGEVAEHEPAEARRSSPCARRARHPLGRARSRPRCHRGRAGPSRGCMYARASSTG